MKKDLAILLFVFCLFYNTLQAQNKLVIENNNLNEKYEITKGDYIKILYTGYLDQFAEQKVM